MVDQDGGCARCGARSTLRGYQITGDDGAVTFKTIYPGWYRGRAVHIHFKVRESGYEFTSQLFFDPQFAPGDLVGRALRRTASGGAPRLSCARTSA